MAVLTYATKFLYPGFCQSDTYVYRAYITPSVKARGWSWQETCAPTLLHPFLCRQMNCFKKKVNIYLKKWIKCFNAFKLNFTSRITCHKLKSAVSHRLGSVCHFPYCTIETFVLVSQRGNFMAINKTVRLVSVAETLFEMQWMPVSMTLWFFVATAALELFTSWLTLWTWS
jgi:hypothetical protein